MCCETPSSLCRRVLASARLSLLEPRGKKGTYRGLPSGPPRPCRRTVPGDVFSTRRVYSPGRSHCWPWSRLSSPTAAHQGLADGHMAIYWASNGSLYVASSIKVFQMAKSRVPALGVYQLTSVGLSRRTQPGPSFNIRRQCPALPKPGMTVGSKHCQAFPCYSGPAAAPSVLS